MFFTLKKLQLMKQDFELWCSTYIKDSSKSYKEGGTGFWLKTNMVWFAAQLKNFMPPAFTL